MGRRVRKSLTGNVLHFAEGLGLESIAAGTHDFFVNERRAVHQSALELAREVFVGCPTGPDRRDFPLGERIDTLSL